MMTLSIVITNYNYATYLSRSIESAIAQGNHEVVVVDDGSTDDSLLVIDSFSKRVKPIFKSNGGHSSSVNVGFENSIGDLVVFLDADDVMLPGCAAAILNASSPAVSKVQWGLRTIDSDGSATGHVYPRFTVKHTPVWCRTQLARCSWYDAPPTSGNAWSRKFLSRVMPLPETVGTPSWALDDYLHLLAPYFGDVVSVPAVLGEYRIHQSQMSALKTASLDRVRSDCSDEQLRYSLVNGVLERFFGESEMLDPMKWSSHVLGRLMLLKSGDPKDRIVALVIAYLRAYALADVPVKSKLVNSVYGLALALAPRWAASWLVRARLEATAAAFSG